MHEPRSATSQDEELARLDQALEDLAACDAASVALAHCPSAAAERSLVRALTTRARERGFVTAEVSMREHGLETPDGLVRALLESLTPPGESRPCGLTWLLEGFYDQHGDGSAGELARRAAHVDANGDLTALCLAYLATDDPNPVAELRAFRAWCDGVEPPRRYRNEAVRRALSERTAQRALNELTRLVRALGYPGTFAVLSEGDALAQRTERQREKAYTLLRELVDNFDTSAGAIATRLLLTGQAPLFEGDHSITSVAPLAMRLSVPSSAAPAPPHRSWTTLVKRHGEPAHRPTTEPGPRRAAALRNLIRIAEGLPPTDGITQMSVGQERLDRTVANLFKLVSRAGGFFSALVGEYGSGKTHLMMHLAERALEDQRPVFWLNLERTNLDLGNPARHLMRFLEHSQLPLKNRPNALSLASRWTRGASAIAALRGCLAELAAGDGEAALAARKALRIADHAGAAGFALENFLAGADLEDRPGSATYRRDAYRRIFLWFELLAQLENIRGPVVLIDEAENLYTSGRPPASRRTALRSLAFYCGGALPATCVILAMTPPAFEELKGEARDLLAEAGDMESTLELENVERFRRSLWGLKPDPVKPLTRHEREELAAHVRAMHKSVRGNVAIADWPALTARLIKDADSPRALIRALIDELESAWWAGGGSARR
jgi:hypothetical protein